MALPVTYEYPVVPIAQYDPNVPPAVPNITTFPQVQHLVPLVSSRVANEAGMRANASAARMFCYNLLVNYFWQNTYFADIVKLVCDHIYVCCAKGKYRAPEQGIDECVTDVLTLYTSNLLFEYPDLKSVTAPPVVDAAYQNVPTFNSLKQEIFQMYNNMQVGMHPGYGQHNVNMGVNAHTPMMHHGVPMPGYQPAMPVMPGNMYPNNPGMGSCFTPENTFTRPTDLSQGQSNMSLGSASDIKQDRFFSRLASENRNRAEEQQPTVVVEDKPKQTHLILNEGDTEMDRAKHQIVYFGGNYASDNSERTRKYIESATKLNEEVAINDESSDEVNPSLYTSWLMETSIDTVVNLGKVRQIEYQSSLEETGIFRCFGIVVNPVISKDEVRPYGDNLRKARNMSEFCDRMRAIAISLNQQENAIGYTQSIVSYLSTIDNFLTEVINDYLLNNLSIPLTIDCFSEDYDKLGEYIKSKYGLNYYQAYQKFENELIAMLHLDLESADEVIKEQFGDDDFEPKFDVIPLNCSFTYLNMRSKDLGYVITTPEAVIIDKLKTPTLYLLVRSLQQHKKEADMTAMYDYFITSDNVKYRVYSSDVVPDMYRIKKV